VLKLSAPSGIRLRAARPPIPITGAKVVKLGKAINTTISSVSPACWRVSLPKCLNLNNLPPRLASHEMPGPAGHVQRQIGGKNIKNRSLIS